MTILIIDTIKEIRELYLFKLLKRFTHKKFTSITEAMICPDIHVLNSVNGTSISIEQVNKLNAEMIYKPFELAVQVGVITDSHLLTTEAQNALLKSLEDHSDKTVYILLVNNEFNLLETIVSRCKKYYANRRRRGVKNNDYNNSTNAYTGNEQTHISGTKNIHDDKEDDENADQEITGYNTSEINTLIFSILSNDLLLSFQSIIKIVDLDKEEKEKNLLNTMFYNLMSIYKDIYENIGKTSRINTIIEQIYEIIIQKRSDLENQSEDITTASTATKDIAQTQDKTILHSICKELSFVGNSTQSNSVHHASSNDSTPDSTKNVTTQKNTNDSTQNSQLMNRIKSSIEAIELARSQIEASTNKRLALENMILKLRRLANPDLN